MWMWDTQIHIICMFMWKSHVFALSFCFGHGTIYPSAVNWTMADGDEFTTLSPSLSLSFSRSFALNRMSLHNVPMWWDCFCICICFELSNYGIEIDGHIFWWSFRVRWQQMALEYYVNFSTILCGLPCKTNWIQAFMVIILIFDGFAKWISASHSIRQSFLLQWCRPIKPFVWFVCRKQYVWLTCSSVVVLSVWQIR